MASISITDPPADGTVGWTFTASGGYDTAPGEKPADAGGGISLSCTLSDSTGAPIQGQNVRLPNVPSGPWSADFAVDQDYAGCTITAVLLLSGSPAASDSVGGIDITGS